MTESMCSKVVQPHPEALQRSYFIAGGFFLGGGGIIIFGTTIRRVTMNCNFYTFFLIGFR